MAKGGFSSWAINDAIISGGQWPGDRPYKQATTSTASATDVTPACQRQFFIARGCVRATVDQNSSPATAWCRRPSRAQRLIQPCGYEAPLSCCAYRPVSSEVVDVERVAHHGPEHEGNDVDVTLR